MTKHFAFIYLFNSIFHIIAIYDPAYIHSSYWLVCTNLFRYLFDCSINQTPQTESIELLDQIT